MQVARELPGVPKLDVAERQRAGVVEEETLRIERRVRILLERADVERAQAMQRDEQRERVQLGVMLRRAEVVQRHRIDPAQLRVEQALKLEKIEDLLRVRGLGVIADAV